MKNRIELAETINAQGQHVLNELYIERIGGKKEYQWFQTVENNKRLLFHFISEKNMRQKMREWDFYFEKE